MKEKHIIILRDPEGTFDKCNAYVFFFKNLSIPRMWATNKRNGGMDGCVYVYVCVYKYRYVKHAFLN